MYGDMQVSSARAPGATPSASHAASCQAERVRRVRMGASLPARPEVPVDGIGFQITVDALVAMRVEVREELLANRRRRLDAHELRPEALDVEAGQRGRLGLLDVHREEVDLLDAAVVEHFVQ